MTQIVYKVGDKVAWMMLDHNLMAGDVTSVGTHVLHIRRVDGSDVSVYKHDTSLRIATDYDIEKAVAFFKY